MKAKRERRMWESSGFDLRSTRRGGRVKRGDVRRRFDPRRMFFVGMQIRDAVALIADAIPRDAGNIWADFGAGDGTFTRALVELLGPESRIYAIDRDARALAAIDAWPDAVRRSVTPVVADFTRPLDNLPELDGALFANTLHFVPNAGEVLARLARLVKPGGRVVVIEYDRRAASRWVPYPIASSRLPSLAMEAGLSTPVITARRPSDYGGEIYVASLRREALAR